MANLRSLSSLLLLLSSLLLATTARANPEMARFGYFSCTACHVSPAGGGVLTPYGRGLSADRMSTWNYENEQQLLGIPQAVTPEWLALGGDFRSVQTHVETGATRDGRWIRMQYDVGAAVILPHATVSLAGGPRGDANVPDPEKHSLRFREYYAKFDALEGQLHLRAGRFYPRYGLVMAQHNVNVRQGLGFNDGQENLNSELTWITENHDLAVTRLFGARKQELEGNREKGWAASWAYSLFGKHRVGASALTAEVNGGKRTTFDLNGVFKLNDKWFLMTEADRQHREAPGGAGSNQVFAFNRIGFEPVQGVIPFFQAENTIANTKDLKSRVDTYSLGSQWYPRPHFDFETALGTVLNHTSYTYVATGYLLVHYYL